MADWNKTFQTRMSDKSKSARFLRIFACLVLLVICFILMTSMGGINVPIYNKAMGSEMDRGCNLLDVAAIREVFNHSNCSCSKSLEETLVAINKTVLEEENKDGHEDEPLLYNAHLIKPKKGKEVMSDTLTGDVWSFKDIEAERLYLYEKLLEKDWSINSTNLRRMREELASYRKQLNGSSLLIMHQKNVKPKQDLRFPMGQYSRTKKSVTLTLDYFNRLIKENPFPEDHKYKTCAIVGNSGSLQNSSCGSTIDRNDYVFRCNIAPLKPFKDDAGLRSNFTTMNPSLLWKKYHSLKNAKAVQTFNDEMSNYSGLLWVPCFGMFPMYSITYKALKVFNLKNPTYVCGHPDHHKAVLDFWADRGLVKRLSTGFYLVTVALQVCDEINLYGFWPFPVRFDTKRSSVPYHYFDNVQMGGAVHAMDEEFNLLLQLHNMGVFHMHTGACS